MKMGFYPKLAVDGIRKNKRMYLPFILTCIGMIMMLYIISYLHWTDTLKSMPGGTMMQEIMNFGSMVIAAFACIFLFYTNFFLMRRRKKEFGLYHILGMGKRNIAVILFWETLFIACVSLVLGLLSGITCSKLFELGLIYIMHGSVTYTLSVSMDAIRQTASFFGIIFILLFLNGLRQVHFSTTLSLLRSENTGEKPPKANWLLGILGFALLLAAYYMAVTIENPITALAVFFIAVLLVIAATYLIMIAGSVFFCRLLQRRKAYYYRANHFISVSSMIYRMKRNGAGLASICILATMVLVMLSSTASLYFGSEDAILTRYPREINIDVQSVDGTILSEEQIAALDEKIQSAESVYGSSRNRLLSYRYISTSGLLKGDTILLDSSSAEASLDFSNLFQIYLIPLEDYNRLADRQETLAEGEALLCFYHHKNSYSFDTLNFENGPSFRIAGFADSVPDTPSAAMAAVPTLFVVVPDPETMAAEHSHFFDSAPYHWTCSFDTGLDSETQTALSTAISNALREDRFSDSLFAVVESRAANRDDFFMTFGGLLYLAILLSLVFILATVLIIYYKQISEGYEDQSRFAIMQKVGMTGKEIRKSINSQLLTVFFFPLILAALHMIFAFPMVRKILLLFNLNNLHLFAGVTLISFLIFAFFYTLVYRITSNAYYNIVSGAREEA